MIKKLPYFFVLFMFVSASLKAQVAPVNDTAVYPIWADMMRAPDANYYKVKRAFDLYFNDTIPGRGYGYKVFKRWEWRVLDNMLPDGTVRWNTGALNEPGFGNPGGGGGYQAGGMAPNAAPCPGSGRWTPMGPIRHPYNQSGQPTGIGRINGITFHPSDSNTLFALAPQGGVWKTTNNGQTWTHLFGAGPVVNTIGVSTMVLSYNNPDTMYIGTGDRDAGDAPGFGVLWSTNGGQTWATRNSGMGNRIVGKLIMHPRNSAILLAATNGGIWRSTNSGATWTVTNNTGNFTDIVFHPRNPSIVYATRNGLFFRSADNGQSWTQITSGLPASSSRGQIAVSRANRGYVYFVTTSGAPLQGFYRSTDSGQTFSTRSTAPNILGYYDGTSGTSDLSNGQGWYDLDIDADPNNAEIVYVGGINIWKTINGGLNWTQVGHWYGGFSADDIHADQHSIDFNPRGTKLYSGNDGGVYYSNNGGSRWINVSTGIMNSQIYRLAHARTDEFISAEGYQDNGSSQTSNDEFYTYYGGDGMDCQVDPTDASFVYGSYVFGRIYRAINKNTINTVGANGAGGINENGNWLTPFILQEGQPGTMFAGYSNVWRTTNVKTGNPATWTRITTGFGGIRMLENSMARNQMLYVLQNSGNIQRTGNATAATPAWLSLGGGPGGVRWIEAHHRDSNRVYCVNSGSLFRSTNKGATWTAIATPSGAGALNMCLIDTSSRTELIYIGTERGVYIWDSASAQVINFNSGFPLWGDVTDLDIWYSPRGRDQSKIVASTYGRGVWRSHLYDPGLVKPKSRFYAFDSTFTVGGKMRLYEKSEGTVSSFRWRITPYAYSYAEGTDSTSMAPVLVFNRKGRYTVQLVTSNCQGTDTFVKRAWVKVFDRQVNPQCVPTTSFYTQSVAIGLFRISLSDNSSETGGYFDDDAYLDRRTDKVFRLKPSTSYTVTAKTGLYNNENVRMFLDYNGDGRFQNFRNEVLPVSSGFGSRTFNFTTPASPRMNRAMTFRILSDFNTLDTNACRNMGYGQGEDYTFVFDQPIPYFRADKFAVCTNETVTFTDTSDGLVGTWDWDFGSGATPRTATGQGPHQVRYSTTGTKNVRLRIEGRDSLVRAAYITVNRPADPFIVVKTGVNPGCEGRAMTFAVRDRNGVSATRQWIKDGSNLSGRTDSLLSFSAVAHSDTGFYTVLMDNGGCRTTSPAVKLVAYARPRAAFVLNSPNPQCLRGNSFSFTDNSTSTRGSITHRWDFGNGAGSVLASPVYAFTAFGNFNVKLVVTTSFGCRDSQTLSNVTVNPNPRSFFTANDSDQCLSGNTFIFTNVSSIAAGSIASRRWFFGDGGTSTVASPSKTYASRGNYTVRLVNVSAAGCTDTFSKPVRVYGQSAVAFTLNNDQQCLKGNRFSATNTSTSADGSLTYRWTFGNGQGSTIQNPVFSYAGHGAYQVWLRATSSFGCRDSISRTVDVWPQANPRFRLSDSDQCLRNNDFRFTNLSSIPSGTLSHSWSFGDGGSSALKDPVHSYGNFGTYTVRLFTSSDKSCRDTFTSSVRVYAMPQAAFSISPSSACLRGNRFVSSGSGSVPEGTFTTTWRNGDGSTGTGTNNSHSYSTDGRFTVRQILTSNFGCMDSLSRQVDVYPMPVARFTPVPAQLCVNERSVMNLQSTISSGTLTHQWQFGPSDLRSGDTASIAYASNGVALPRLISISDKGCRDTAVAAITIEANPTAAFTVFPNPACALQSVLTFTNQSVINTVRSLDYQWLFGDASGSTVRNPRHTYADTGTYFVKLVTMNASRNKCRDSVTVPVRIHPRVTAAFATRAVNRETREFTALDTTIPGYSYRWYFGDGSEGSGRKTRYMFGSNRSFDVKLVVSNDIGCIDSVTGMTEILSPNYKPQDNPLNAYVYPNPTTGQFTYKFELSDTRTVDVKLYDILGQKPLYSATWTDATPGTHFESVNMRRLGLSAGTYPFIITAGDQQWIVKIIYTGGE